MLFSKPKIDEKEQMIQQRKKASFNSKFAKFEGTKEPVMIKKDSLTKVHMTSRMFRLSFLVLNCI